MRIHPCRLLAVGGAVLAIIVLGVFAPEASGGDPPSASLTYTVTPATDSNVTRVASLNEMLYPRLAIDRDPASPFNDTLYVVGLDNFTCASIVVRKSVDGGRSFQAPLVSDLCLMGPTVDVAVGRNGTLLAAVRGPAVLRSADGGASWAVLAALNGTDAPAAASITTFPLWDTAYITWTPADSEWSRSPGPVYVSTSLDGGRNWSAPTDVLGGGSGGNRPQVAVHGSHIVIGYTATGTDGPYVAAVASSDGGGTWGSATAVGPANSCPPPSWRPEPSIAVSRDGLFGLTWSAERSCSTGWGDDAEAWVSTSADGGETFRSPVKAGGPPGWAWGRALGDQLVFDDESRPYVTWHSISPGWTSASVYVASAPTATGTYTNGSFTTRLETSGGNSTAQENLAVGPRGLVFLLWERFDPTANASDPSVGIFLRPVVGEAEGDVVVYAQPDPTLEVVVRDPATGAIVARLLGAGNPTTIPGLVPATYPVWVHAGNSSVPAGALPVKPWSRTVFTVVVGERPGGPALPVIAVAGAGVAVLVAALAGAAVWRRRRRDRSPPPGPSAGP